MEIGPLWLWLALGILIFFFGDAVLSLTTGDTFPTLCGVSEAARHWEIFRWTAVALFIPTLVGVQWFKLWSLLPPPTTTIVEGTRITLEGTIVDADEAIPVPAHPEKPCVAWVYEYVLNYAYSMAVERYTRARPFKMRLSTGQIVHLTVVTPHWHTLGFAYRTEALPESLTGRDDHENDIFNVAMHEYPSRNLESEGDYNGYHGHPISRFATVQVGDTVTISGFFTKNHSHLENTHYRGTEDPPSFHVQRASELPGSQLPRQRSLANYRGRGPNRFTNNEVLLFPATYREASRSCSPAGLDRWQAHAVFLLAAVVAASILAGTTIILFQL